MSATPVPRTLQLSLAGVRDLAVIETPPRDRMAVETAILPFDARSFVREAIEFEMEPRRPGLLRLQPGGDDRARWQAYLKEVGAGAQGHGGPRPAGGAGAGAAYARLRGWGVRRAPGHDDHRERHRHPERQYHDRATGRTVSAWPSSTSCAAGWGGATSWPTATSWCPADRVLSEVASKRLDGIREFTDLGAGFRVAGRDLEIRGAGNMLGGEQSGHIAAVGIETYLKLLEETVRELKGEAVEEKTSVVLDLPLAMSIPEDYISDANLRMEIYRRIASTEEPQETVLEELRDRFGKPPESVRTLLEVAALKRLAESLRLQAVSARGRKIVFRLRQDARVEPERVIELVSENPRARFSPDGVLSLEGVDPNDLLGSARETLEHLAS